MRYTKLPITIQEQIRLMEERGLHFGDKTRAEHYLSNISYYRLRAYTYPFQDNSDPEHPFITEVSFEQVIALYVFDRQLRLLILDAIEKIEVALRTKIIYTYALSEGSFWHHQPAMYKDALRYANHMESLQNEVDRSKETFIAHYKKKYTSPAQPPCWMALEVSSIGLLAKIYQNLRLSDEKKAVSRHFGISDVKIFENWIHCFCNLRNICAHHGRVWNRRLIPFKIPNYTLRPFLANTRIYNNKLYAVLCGIEYILKEISPTSNFKDRLKEHVRNCPLGQAKEMGFPVGWEKDKLWN